MTSALDELARSLAACLARDDVTPEIDELRRLTGGASRETWSFTAAVGGAEPERLVLRRDPPGEQRVGSMSVEAKVLAAAAAAGVPVPRVRASGDDLPIVGGAFMIMNHVAGQSIPRRILRDEQYRLVRDRLGRQCGRVLAAIHAVPLPALDRLDHPDPLVEIRRQYDDLDRPSTAFEIGFRWLTAHPPPPHGPALIHGDFRMGNLIVTAHDLAAVLDWEVTHIGDPLEDVGWFFVRAWRFGALTPGGGVASHDELLDGYAEVAGWRPTLAEVAWWQMLGTLRWGVGCMGIAARSSDAIVSNVEAAGIARRVAENELAVLELVRAEGW